MGRYDNVCQRCAFAPHPPQLASERARCARLLFKRGRSLHPANHSQQLAQQPRPRSAATPVRRRTAPPLRTSSSRPPHRNPRSDSQRLRQNYSSTTPPAACIVEMRINTTMKAPIFIYYEVSNFYQNHRRRARVEYTPMPAVLHTLRDVALPENVSATDG